MAKRRLVAQHFQEASCMYRLIVQWNYLYSDGWVGWAVCEGEQGHAEAARLIYQLALQLLPEDHYIVLFAADFYLSIQQVDQAVALLQHSHTRLLANGEEASASFAAIHRALEEIEQR